MRCFIGIPIEKEHSQSLLNEISPFLSFPGVRLIPVENMHLTIKFLGELNEFELEKVRGKLENFSLKNFKINFNGIGFFPSENYVRIVYINTELEKNVELNLKQLCSEIKFGEPFTKLHLTIARVSSKCDFSLLKKNFQQKEFFVMHANEISIYQSILAKPYSIYKKFYSKFLD